MTHLEAFIAGRHVGTFSDAGHGPQFAYAQQAQADPDLPAISLCMPKARQRHGGGKVRNWLWNLLPDPEDAIRRIAADTSRGLHRVSPRNPLALLEKVGEDCPGAIQLIRPERLDALDRDELEPVDEAGIAARLREVKTGRDIAGRRRSDRGRFSLAGMQSKTALYRSATGEWGVPSGRLPTTHILKPPVPHMEGQVENEHFCLDLAARLGFAVAPSAVQWFEDQVAIVVTRYDRTPADQGPVQRLHQEDMCQALGLPPWEKYQTEGGPGIHDIVTRVLPHSSAAAKDVQDFMRAVAYNFVLAGTDAHAKNYALLLAAANVRLAPLYDINSFLPYGLDADLTLSMSVGRRYEVTRILPRHWVKQAQSLGLDADAVLEMVRDLLARMPDAAAASLAGCRAAGLTTSVLDALADGLGARCRQLATLYGQEARAPAARLPLRM